MKLTQGVESFVDIDSFFSDVENADSQESESAEKRKKERPLEIKRVHDSKDNRVRLSKPLVVRKSYDDVT